MNIDNFYVAQINIVYDRKISLENSIWDTSISYYFKFLKKSIVYRKHGEFYDLKTNEKYMLKGNIFSIGDVFIDAERIIPLRDVLEEKNIKYKENTSKCRVKRMIYGGKYEKNI